MINYKNILDQARQNKVWGIDLHIAEEVQNALDYYELSTPTKDFNILCDNAYLYYNHNDDVRLENVARAVAECYQKYGLKFNQNHIAKFV